MKNNEQLQAYVHGGGHLDGCDFSPYPPPLGGGEKAGSEPGCRGHLGYLGHPGYL